MNDKLLKMICSLSWRLVVVFFAMTGCKSSNNNTDEGGAVREVKGQMFIVQQNRQNVKMGAVSVYLLDYSIFNNNLKATADDYKLAETLNNYEKLLGKFEAELLRLQVGSGEGESVKQAALEANEKVNMCREKISGSPLVVQLRDKWRSHILNAKYYEGTSFERLDMHQWCLTNIFHDVQGLARQITVTDADGRFSLQLPVGERCIVLASASRAITGDKTEHYYWVYQVSSEINGELMLSTPNTLDARGFNDLLRECGAELRSLPTDYVESKIGAPDLSWRIKWRQAVSELSAIEREEHKTKKQLEYQKSKLKRLLNSN